MTEGLSGKRVIVVGGTSGMGRGAVSAAIASGAEVVSAGSRPAEQQDPPAGADPAQVDVTDETSVRSLFEAAGPLDHLVVTASPGSTGAFLEQDLAAAQRYLHGKFFGSWMCARYAAPALREGASITFLSGGLAVRPDKGAHMVTCSFAAVEALGRALAVELAPVRVNTIRPGFVDSSMWDFLDDEDREKMREENRTTLPARRVGTVEDIGDAAVYLMTSPYVTGTVLEVNGGQLLV